MLSDISTGEELFALMGGAPLHRYRVFDVAKRRGGFRTIQAPFDDLKRVQRRLAKHLAWEYRGRPPVHGYINQRSVRTNAECHVGKSFVLNIDLRDFFSSIHFGRIRGLLKCGLYAANDEVATGIASLCTYKGLLPQGAPTSPVLSNMVCAAMDEALAHFSRRYGCIYTRYSDDITISCTSPIFPAAIARIVYRTGIKDVILGDALRELISAHGFSINEKKTRLLAKSDRQEVTGLVTNVRVNVPRKYYRNIRGALNAWRKYGFEATNARFRSKYLRGQKNHPDFRDVLRGRIQYLGSIRGFDDTLYVRLRGQFNELNSSV